MVTGAVRLFQVSVSSLLFGIGSLAFATPKLNYTGRLVAPNGQAVTSSSVQFQIQVRSPGAEDCLMYQEVQTKNLSSSNGYFSLKLGDRPGLALLYLGFAW